MTTRSGLPTGSERACAATPHELAEGLRKHYADVSLAACDWQNQIPVAIDMWEAVKNGAPDPRAALARQGGEREARQRICVKCGRPEWQGGICPMSSSTAAAHVYGYTLAASPPEASEEDDG